MRAENNLITLENTLVTLTNEHKKILTELSHIEGLLKEGGNSPARALTVFNNIKKFLVAEHHKREDTVLFEWMLHQNATVDEDIIARIRRDHLELEALLKTIELEKDSSLQAFDLQDFVDLYREHVALEEQFIFQIARGLMTAKKSI